QSDTPSQKQNETNKQKHIQCIKKKAEVLLQVASLPKSAPQGGPCSCWNLLCWGALHAASLQAFNPVLRCLNLCFLHLHTL
uniref:Uncharacterized protein n=1 Tax=Macaca mulatta TaxID=9544 RepID=A0A5F8AKE7_MACMU